MHKGGFWKFWVLFFFRERQKRAEIITTLQAKCPVVNVHLFYVFVVFLNGTKIHIAANNLV